MPVLFFRLSPKRPPPAQLNKLRKTMSGSTPSSSCTSNEPEASVQCIAETLRRSLRIRKRKAQSGNPADETCQEQAVKRPCRLLPLGPKALCSQEPVTSREHPDNHMSPAITTNRESRLLALPSEILQMILCYVLLPGAMSVVPIDWPAFFPHESIRNRAIFFASKRLRDEAYISLCRHTTFTIFLAVHIPLTQFERQWGIAQWLRKLRQRVVVQFLNRGLHDPNASLFVTSCGLLGTVTEPGPLANWTTRVFPSLRELTLEVVGMGRAVEDQDEDVEESGKWLAEEMTRQLRGCILCAEMGIPEPKIVGIKNTRIVRTLESAMRHGGEDAGGVECTGGDGMDDTGDDTDE